MEGAMSGAWWVWKSHSVNVRKWEERDQAVGVQLMWGTLILPKTIKSISRFI